MAADCAAYCLAGKTTAWSADKGSKPKRPAASAKPRAARVAGKKGEGKPAGEAEEDAVETKGGEGDALPVISEPHEMFLDMVRFARVPEGTRSTLGGREYYPRALVIPGRDSRGFRCRWFGAMPEPSWLRVRERARPLVCVSVFVRACAYRCSASSRS